MTPAVFAIGHLASNASQFSLIKRIALAGHSKTSLYAKKLTRLQSDKHATEDIKTLISHLIQHDGATQGNPITHYAQHMLSHGLNADNAPLWLSIYHHRFLSRSQSPNARFLFAITPHKALSLNDHEITHLVEAYLQETDCLQSFPKYVSHYLQSRTYFDGVYLTQKTKNIVNLGLNFPTPVSLSRLTDTYARKFDIHPALTPRFNKAIHFHYIQHKKLNNTQND